VLVTAMALCDRAGAVKQHPVAPCTTLQPHSWIQAERLNAAPWVMVVHEKSTSWKVVRGSDARRCLPLPTPTRRRAANRSYG
jgi:hypothetical protein